MKSWVLICIGNPICMGKVRYPGGIVLFKNLSFKIPFEKKKQKLKF